jgi:hypothetical protein
MDATQQDVIKRAFASANKCRDDAQSLLKAWELAKEYGPAAADGVHVAYLAADAAEKEILRQIKELPGFDDSVEESNAAAAAMFGFNS